MLQGYFKKLKKGIREAEQDIQNLEIGFSREQEFRSESPIIMNETDFLEPEESGETPVDMFNIDDEENVRRRDAILKQREFYDKILSKIAVK